MNCFNFFVLLCILLSYRSVNGQSIIKTEELISYERPNVSSIIEYGEISLQKDILDSRLFGPIKELTDSCTIDFGSTQGGMYCKHTKVYAFNPKGKITSVITKDKKNGILNQRFYEYDEFGSEIHRSLKDSSGNIIREKFTELERDQHGNIVMKKITPYDLSLPYEEIEYSENGKIKKKVFSDSLGNIVKSEIYTYSNTGTLTFKRIENHSLNTYSRHKKKSGTEFKYNEEGLLSHQKDFGAFDIRDNEKFYEYNSSRDCIAIKSEGSSTRWDFQYFNYDFMGNLVEKRRVDEDGVVSSSTIYQLKYDKYNNWTEKRIYLNSKWTNLENKLEKIEFRKIRYSE